MPMIHSNIDDREAEALAHYHASQQQAQERPEPTRQREAVTSVTYAVHRGDTLRGIAEWFYGDPSRWREIYAANRSTLRDPQEIEAGMVLRIPRQGGSKPLA